jgi:hypothetical protein
LTVCRDAASDRGRGNGREKKRDFCGFKVLEVCTTYLGESPMKKVLISGLLVLVAVSCVIAGMHTRIARYADARGNALGAAHLNPVGWYRLSALMGSREAMYNLGISYYYGTGVPKDHTKAASWFENSALAGDPDGMYFFGYACLHGDGVLKDEPKGVQWEEKAADAGSSDALYNMAVWHRDGLRGFPKDEVKALAFAEKAALGGNGCNNGNEKALQYLADKYRPKEPWKAYRWEQMLADKGNYGAMLRVAKANILYEDSFFSLAGSPRDLAKASHYLDELDAHHSDTDASMGEYVDFLKSRLNSAAATIRENANSAGALSDFNQFRANATTPTPSAARDPELVIETADLSHEHLGPDWSSAHIVVFNRSDRTLNWVFAEYSVYDQGGAIIGQGVFQFSTLPPHTRASQVSGLHQRAARVVVGKVSYE